MRRITRAEGEILRSMIRTLPDTIPGEEKKSSELSKFLEDSILYVKRGGEFRAFKFSRHLGMLKHVYGFSEQGLIEAAMGLVEWKHKWDYDD